MKMINCLSLRIIIGLAFTIACSLSASGDESQTNSNKVEGAFGLKLGDTFDLGTNAPRFVENFSGVPDPMHKAYKFTPQKPIPPFNNYYVQITPKTHKVFLIFARVSKNEAHVLGLPEDVQEQLRVVATALYNKYGKSFVSDDGSTKAYPTARTDDHCTYVMFLFNEIQFTRDDLECQRAESKFRIDLTGNINTGFQLLYKDYSLWNLAERENTELKNDHEQTEQRKAAEKVKALEKSGI